MPRTSRQHRPAQLVTVPQGALRRVARHRARGETAPPLDPDVVLAAAAQAVPPIWVTDAFAALGGEAVHLWDLCDDGTVLTAWRDAATLGWARDERHVRTALDVAARVAERAAAHGTDPTAGPLSAAAAAAAAADPDTVDDVVRCAARFAALGSAGRAGAAQLLVSGGTDELRAAVRATRRTWPRQVERWAAGDPSGTLATPALKGIFLRRERTAAMRAHAYPQLTQTSNDHRTMLTNEHLEPGERAQLTRRLGYHHLEAFRNAGGLARRWDASTLGRIVAGARAAGDDYTPVSERAALLRAAHADDLVTLAVFDAAAVVATGRWDVDDCAALPVGEVLHGWHRPLGELRDWVAERAPQATFEFFTQLARRGPHASLADTVRLTAHLTARAGT